MNGAYKRRTILKAGLAIGALQVASPFLRRAIAQAPVTLRMHTHVPPVAASYKNLGPPGPGRREAASGGKLKIQLFGANQLGGKAADVYGQVADGVVDIGWTLPATCPVNSRRSTVFELPFIGDKADLRLAGGLGILPASRLKEKSSATRTRWCCTSGGSFVLHMKGTRR